MNTSPKTIRTNPAICSSRNWFRVIERPTAAAPAPSSTNTATSPADERKAGQDDPPRRAWLAEPVRLDGRDRREVSGHERQDAGRQERDEAGAEGDRGRAGAHGSKRASSASSRRSTSGSSGGSSPRRVAHAAPAPREHAPTTVALDRQPCERQQPRDPVESLPRRHRQDARAEVGDELRLDLALRVARGDPRADERLHPARDRSVGGVEGRLADRDRRARTRARPRVGRLSLAAACAAKASASEREREQPHAGAWARSIPSSRSDSSSTGPAIR